MLIVFCPAKRLRRRHKLTEHDEAGMSGNTPLPTADACWSVCAQTAALIRNTQIGVQGNTDAQRACPY